jgi:hypothetical protein
MRTDLSLLPTLHSITIILQHKDETALHYYR